MLKLQRLRARVENELGEKFEQREFHDVSHIRQKKA
jgi:uncharacterized protein (DUF885 family)